MTPPPLYKSGRIRDRAPQGGAQTGTENRPVWVCKEVVG